MAVQVALDPWMVRSGPLEEAFTSAAEAGYAWLELSPRDDFMPLYRGRRADAASITRIRELSRDSGVGIASLFVVYRWANPDEFERRQAVRYWAAAIDVADRLGVSRLNTEFSSASDAEFPQGAREASWWVSIEEIIPMLESAGMVLAIEPHPGDFIEGAKDAIDLIRAAGSDRLAYLHCVPHTYWLGASVAEIVAYVGPLLTHVHVADTFSPTRIIANVRHRQTAEPRPHMHIDIGRGEIEWEEVAAALRSVGFAGLLTVCVFGYEERAADSFAANRRAVARLFEGEVPV